MIKKAIDIEATFTNNEELSKFSEVVKKKVINFQELKNFEQNEKILEILSWFNFNFEYSNDAGELIEITFTNVKISKKEYKNNDYCKEKGNNYCYGRTIKQFYPHYPKEVSSLCKKLYNFKYLILFGTDDESTITNLTEGN